MKAKIVITIIVLLCITLLAGCGCEHVFGEATCITPRTCSVCGKSDGVLSDHTWTDATCLAPKTCTICGITEGTLAEHTWAEATCMAPQTCTLCSATGEKKLEHSWQPANCEMPEHCSQCGIKRGGVVHTFGNWQVENALSETMSRTCSGCQLEETDERNDLTLANQGLVGYWDFATPSGNQDTPQPYVYFPAQGNGIFYDGENTYEIQRRQFFGTQVWQVSYGYRTEYYFSFYIPELDELVAKLEVDDAGAVPYLSIQTSDDILTFFRIPSVETAVTGTYNMVHEGQIRQITLHEDRTLTGNLFGKEISGTWQLPPIRGGGGYGYSLDVRFYYTMDGKDCCATSYYKIYNGDVSLLEYLESSRLDMRLMIRDGYDEKYYDLYPADEEGHRLLVGQWASTKICVSSRQSHVTLRDEYTEAYSITFSEDGTFTATLDNELQGIWILTEKTLWEDNRIYYYYEFFCEGNKYTARAELVGDTLEVTLYDQSTDLQIDFISMSGEALAKRVALQAEAAKPLSGEWISTYCEYSHYAGWKWLGRDYKQTFDYRLTFAEDGTFTATFDQDYSGTWKCISIEEIYDSFFVYEYSLAFDGEKERVDVVVTFGHPDGVEAAKKEHQCSMVFRYQPRGKDSVDIEFRQFTPESLRKAQDAVQQAVGTWTAISATQQKWETWEELGEVPNCNFTLTINANGTYTVVLDRTYTGTWIYSLEVGGYLFSASDSGNYAYIANDGTLRSFHHKGVNYFFEIHFRKN